MKIKILITIAFVVLALIGISLGGVFLLNKSNVLLEQQVVQHLETAAESRAEHIQTYLEQNIERLKLINSRTKLRDVFKAYNANPKTSEIDSMLEIIKDAKEPIPEFESITLVNLAGKIVVSTEESFDTLNLSKEGYFSNGKIKNDIYFIEKDNKIKMLVSGPLILNGETLGVGIITVNLNRLEKIVKDQTGLGNTGEVLVAINKDGKRLYLFERLFESAAINQDLETENIAEPMKVALEGKEMAFINSLDYRNQKVIAFSQYIELGKIGLVAKVDYEEILGQYQNQLIKETIQAIAIALILVIIFGFLISSLISKPLNNLTEKVNQITKGELELQLDHSNINELETLTQSLNRILASLKLAILRTGATGSQLGIGEVIKLKNKAEILAEKRKEQLEKFVRLSSGREERIIELKKELANVKGEKYLPIKRLENHLEEYMKNKKNNLKSFNNNLIQNNDKNKIKNKSNINFKPKIKKIIKNENLIQNKKDGKKNNNQKNNQSKKPARIKKKKSSK